MSLAISSKKLEKRILEMPVVALLILICGDMKI
jgi:hypothetical protein